MNRRLLTILLPLAAGTLAASCSTITDNDVVARVDDAELSVDDLGELAAAQGIAADETLDAEVARQLVTEWIRAGVVSDDNIAEIYNSGIDVAGITCAGLLVTPTIEEADAARDRILGGEAFADVFADVNVDEQLATVGGEAGCFQAGQFDEVARQSPDVAALFSISAANPLATAVSSGATGSSQGLVVEFRDLEALPVEISSQIVELLSGEQDFTAALSGADIHVDPRYGIYDSATASVVALG